MDKGPYGAFVKLVPGHSDGLHTHTNASRMVVLKGAYVFKPEGGAEQRVGPAVSSVPGGNRHATGPTPGGRSTWSRTAGLTQPVKQAFGASRGGVPIAARRSFGGDHSANRFIATGSSSTRWRRAKPPSDQPPPHR
jgi:hypothetical protein